MSTMDDLKVGQALLDGQIRSGSIITLGEAANRLGVTTEMIRKFIRQGWAYHLIVGRKMYVSAADIEKLKLRDTRPGRKPRRKEK